MRGLAGSGVWRCLLALAFAASSTVVAAGDARVVSADRPILVEMGNIGGDEVRVFIDNADYSALVRVPAPGQLLVDTRLAPLSPGEHNVRVYRVTPEGEWLEWQSETVRVRHFGGFDEAEFLPRLSLDNEGQVDQEAHGDAFEQDPATYQDLNTRAGFSTRLARGPLEISTDLNAFGVSRREDALRFGEFASEAPKFDLADYQVALRYGRATLDVGHISYGEHPLLMQGVGNRGIGLRAQITRRIDFTVSRQNGSRIVGYHRLLGELESEHSITGSSIGIEAFPDRPRLLRAELTWMNASVRNENDFDIGRVQDAEESRGLGVLVFSELWNNRLRLSLAWARSDYTNPEDPVLAQGSALVPVEEEENEARRADITLDLIRNLQLTETVPLSLSLTAAHEQADPLYRSLAAFAQADNWQNRYGVDARVGLVNLSMNFTRQEDNLDDIPSILKTRTRGQGLSVTVPLAEFFRAEDGVAPGWIPSLNYSNNRVHQFAANNPDAAVSGFNGGSHLPDQLNRSQNLGLNWSFDRVQFGWNISRSKQDNRQVGRAQSDFENLTNGVNIGWSPLDSLNINLSASRNRNDNQEQHLKQYSDSGSLSVNWRFLEFWSWGVNLSSNRSHDNADASESRSENFDSRLSRELTLELPLLGEVRGRLFLAYSRSEQENVDRTFNFRNDGESWQFNTGLSLTIF